LQKNWTGREKKKKKEEGKERKRGDLPAMWSRTAKKIVKRDKFRLTEEATG